MLRIIGSYLCLGRTGLFCECDPFPLGKSFVLKTWEAEVSSCHFWTGKRWLRGLGEYDSRREKVLLLLNTL